MISSSYISSRFFAPHANNSLFDPLDTPDLRGIRFTAPYGRNGRFSSLRDFIRKHYGSLGWHRR